MSIFCKVTEIMTIFGKVFGAITNLVKVSEIITNFVTMIANFVTLVPGTVNWNSSYSAVVLSGPMPLSENSES